MVEVMVMDMVIKDLGKQIILSNFHRQEKL